MRNLFLGAVLLALCAASVAAAEQAFGPVTQLPLPRFVSVKAEANVRRGPSTAHRIDWVFQRRHLPGEVTAEFGHWRRVRDHEGAGGWVHYALLSGTRYVSVMGPPATLYRQPNATSDVVARAETGAIARLGECLPDWCRIRAEGMRGWVRKDRLWGVGARELRD